MASSMISGGLKKLTTRKGSRDRSLTSNSESKPLKSLLIPTPKSLSSRKKSGSVDIDAIPADFEKNRANMRALFQLFDDLSKNSSIIKNSVASERNAGKQISSALQSFAVPLSKTDASRSLGELIIEYCKIQSAVEDLRESTFFPMWEQMRNQSDAFIVRLQNTKQAADRVTKAHTELVTVITELIQLVGEENFEKSISFSAANCDLLTVVDDKVDHMAIYRAYLNYHRANRKYHACLLKATHSFEDTFIQKDLEVAGALTSLFSAQRFFYYGAFSKFRQLELTYHIREAFELSESLQQQNKKQKEEYFERDKKRREEKKWVALLEFFDNAGGDILCLANEQEDERILLEKIIKSFQAYNMAVPWLEKLIAHEVDVTAVGSTLLRGNTFITKLLLSFMRVTCGDVMFVPLREIVQEAINSYEKYEVDPNKLEDRSLIEQNMKNLIELVEKFLTIIIDGAPLVPNSLRQVLLRLREETNRKFPDKGTTFAGAIVFLRFICPALVFPETNGLVAESVEVTKEQRRCLMLVSKVLQNLANGVNFREDYMQTMNETFLEKNIPLVQEYFVLITSVPENAPEPPLNDLLVEVNMQDLPFLFHLLYNNMNKLVKHFEDVGNKEKILDLGAVLGKMSLQAQM